MEKDVAFINKHRRLMARIRELYLLEKGWYNPLTGEGEPVNEVAMRNALNWIELHDQYVPIMQVFPLNAGGLMIEYDTDQIGFCHDFNNNGTIEHGCTIL